MEEVTTVVEKKKRYLSYSQFNNWDGCSRKWKLIHIDGLRDKSIHLIFGTAIHEAIQEFLKIYYSKGYKSAKLYDMEQMFEDKLFQLFKTDTIMNEDGTKKFLCDKEELMEFLEDGTLILSEFRNDVRKFFPEDHKLIGTEKRLDVPLTDYINYQGYLDIVTFNEKTEEYVIYDLKTSTRGWRDEDKKNPSKINQLLLYKKFYSDLFNVDMNKIAVEFIILKRKKPTSSEYKISRISRFEPSNGKPSVNKAMISFNRFLNEQFNADGTIIEERIMPNPSKDNCRFCSFKNDKTLCSESYYLKRK